MTCSSWDTIFINKRIVIWGASIGGDQAYHRLEESGLQVFAYCDNNPRKQGTTYNGKPIISPDSLKEQAAKDENYIVIIASYAYEVIYRQIEQLGINCEVYIYLLYDPCCQKQGITYTAAEKSEIQSIYSSEPYTVKLLDLILEKGLLNCNAFGSIKEYLGFGGIEAYFYDSIADKVMEKEPVLTLLDVGSYNGDSILQIKDVFQDRIQKIYSFEPNEENCRYIVQKDIPSITLYKVGLGNKNEQRYFSESGPFFRMSDEKKEGTPVSIARLDDMDLKMLGKSILKIDIEGSEMDCLEGAKEFIKNNRPYIAVCVYHREKDILDIPKYLKGLVPEYQFLLRGGMHTVCYAFPEGV